MKQRLLAEAAMKLWPSRRTHKFQFLCCLLTLFLISSLAVAARREIHKRRHTLALVGAKIYTVPSETPIARGVVLISDGKISAVGRTGKVSIPPDAEILDCASRAIVAGFWNSHVHFTEPKWENAAVLPATQLTEQLQGMLTRYGFVSVVDTGSLLANTVALRRRIESGEVAGPRILTAGLPLYPKEGVPYYVIDSISPDIIKLLPQPSTPEEAVRVVDEDVAQGADVIKVFAVSWVRRDDKKVPLPMPAAIIQAAAAEAHRKGRLVFAHPSTIEGVELVLKGHVDILAHTIEDPERWTGSIVARLKAAKVSLIPTLTLFSGNDDFDGILREVKSYSDAGGQVLFGTDVGYLTDYNSLTNEYELLARAGLTIPQILASLTTAPAARFGFAKRTGRITKGMDADLVVLDADPAHDARAFAKVKYTLRHGRVIYAASPPEKLASQNTTTVR
jgi:imidazolonepropionase-like amidohydrolase